jgi:hypothetical protein
MSSTRPFNSATKFAEQGKSFLGFKVELKGKLTPPGIHQIIPDGWNFYQTMNFVQFLNNTNTPNIATNTPDTEFNGYGSDYEDKTPDVNDDIFALDGPGISGAFSVLKINDNFSVWVRWRGQIASDPALWWVRIKADGLSGSYNVIENNGGTGTNNMDNFY